MKTFKWTNTLTEEEKERNRQLGYRGADPDFCVICSRRVNPDKCWQVLPSWGDGTTLTFFAEKIVTTPNGNRSSCIDKDWTKLTVDGEEWDIQGCFYVGPTCAKKIPLAFRWR